ncbi:putative proline-specific permease put4 [Candida viswanathii]|uniref:Putative proline-specific permease put4 n=1 Tax=Candida viswanathii TaxID=5486 RepID=A0A367YBH4_9ASCO|nr:putative proline-specific permease put4 [Candida viswanathii]
MSAKETNLLTSISPTNDSGSQALNDEKNIKFVEKSGEHISQSSYDTNNNKDTLARGLKSRHLSLIALGGSIGTGLFLGSGLILATCGPASFLIAFIIMSFVVYNVMEYFAEIVLFLPVPGNGPIAFVNDYVSPSFGFAVGYNYWYAFSILVAAEVTAAAMLIEYWTTAVPIVVWITILLGFIVALNFLPVKFYGETEYCLVLIKVVVLIILIITGLVIMLGGGPNGDRLGFRYWKDGLAFSQYLVSGSTGRFLGVWTAVIRSGFSFITGPELISTAIGETVGPRQNGSKAARRFIYRLIFFYVAGSLIIGVIVSSNDPRLIGSGYDASASPFVIGIQNAGIPVLNHIINAAILSSATSAGNSFLYSSSRMLFSMAERGNAPKIFAKVNKHGVPYWAVGASSAFGLLAYLNVSSSSANVFTWLSNLSTISGFLGWIMVGFAYLRWRKAVVLNGLMDRLPYRSILLPYGAYFVIIFLSLVVITNGYAVFFKFDIGDFIAAYITLPIVIVLYFGHVIYQRMVHKDTNWLIPIEKIDLITHLDEIEEEEIDYVVPVPKNFWERIWYWVC